MKGFPLSWQSLEKHGSNSTHEYGRIYFSRSTNANCWISQYSWTKKTAIVRCTEKMGQKMDRTFWTMHLDGPKHLGQKWANRWMLAKQMKQKWAKPSGTKNGPIWLQLQNTRFMGQKKGKNILTSFRQTHNWACIFSKPDQKHSNLEHLAAKKKLTQVKSYLCFHHHSYSIASIVKSKLFCSSNEALLDSLPTHCCIPGDVQTAITQKMADVCAKFYIYQRCT